MTCCCPHSRSGSRVFSFFARNYRKRFSKKGFEPSQRQLMDGLRVAGFADTTVLEVGSGVGHLHMVMLEEGAKSATGIDLSPKMIEEAKAWSEARGLADRLEYHEGDFMDILPSIKPAEVTVLDKVVCCYPDADGLVHASLDRTQRVYALSYPRYRWFIRAAMGFGAIMLKLLGSSFRPYAHRPDEIENWIIEAGFEKQYEQMTFIWLTQVYVKQA
ncbi:MAG: class I SAM-dependent methyltransferase [Gammaproteobacteria bacterium]|nr:class I SAM-dependent methyltransferase [Gammaproteobacteria bacterium]